MGSAEERGVSPDQGGCYPSELACDVQTMSGESVHVRPIRPDDSERLTAFHDHLSPQSVYRRFFFMHLKLSAAEIERFTHVDYVARLALVAEQGGRLVAVGRYEGLPGKPEAEVAFVVADEYKHQGLGTILLEQLAAAALKNGIREFVAQTLADNHDMLDVFMRSGFHVTSSREYGTVNVRFPIDPDDSYRLAFATRHYAADHSPGQSGGSPC
jgi:GNAT superfamily N-acetyltransferase